MVLIISLLLETLTLTFEGQGYMYVGDSTESNPSYRDALVLETRDAANYIDLKRVADVNPLYNGRSNPGVNIDMVYKGNTGSTLSTTDNTNPIKGLLRLGASGRATNASMVIKGVDASNVFWVLHMMLMV